MALGVAIGLGTGTVAVGLAGGFLLGAAIDAKREKTQPRPQRVPVRKDS
jgi:hypothetical protein